MKSLITLLQYIAQDLGDECCTSTVRDVQTITDRVEHEGFAFLGITLANFGADFQKSLDQGFVGSNHFAGFSRSGGLPRFLSGFLCRVFDASSGRLLDDPSIACIRAIRQLTLMWAKTELPTTKSREKKAISGYIECEKEVRHSDEVYRTLVRGPVSLETAFRRIGVLLWADIFSAVDEKVHRGEILPRHSAGNTADSLSGNAKWNQTEWPTRLEWVFPYRDYALPNVRAAGWPDADETRINEVRSVSVLPHLLEPGAERPVKVVPVPKTLKTPRIIAQEPTCMQYMQQGLLLALTHEVEGNRTARRLISWDSQEPNKRLARKASRSGKLATLDLSEASDRVSNQHVRSLLRNHPHLREAVDACRSRKADVRGHGVIRLAKFASMGSALTFPLESMVFMTIIFLAVEEELRRPVTRADIKSYSGRVRCYGDDIIVPVELVPAVTRLLETFGLKVNRDKSFWNGKFRESCGGDYYEGQDVTIVRLRRKLPTHRKHAREIVSTASLRNQLYHAGLWKAVRYLDDVLGRLIPFPVVLDTSPAVGRHSFLGYETQRMHPDLQRAQVRAFRIRAAIPDSHLEGYGALLKCLLPNRDLPFADAEHLERAGRPKAVTLSLGWVNSY